MLQYRRVLLVIFTILLTLTACGSQNTEGPHMPEKTPVPTQGIQPRLTESPTATEEMVNLTKSSLVDEKAEPILSINATAWVGHVIGLPECSHYDDLVLFSPAGVGEYGISGSNPEIEAVIHFLRNATGADEYVHFWGQLICGVDDYNECQLIVDQIHRNGYIEDQAAGWGRLLKCGEQLW